MSDHQACCAGLPEIQLDAGTVLLAKGETTGKLYILIEGELQVLRGEVEIATVTQPGAVFGEISILLGVPHTASVRAVRPTRAYVVEDGRAFLKSKPEVLLYVGKLLATRLQAATAYLADIKRQFAEHGDHLCMVDEVLDSILQHQDTEFTPGSEREPDCPH